VTRFREQEIKVTKKSETKVAMELWGKADLMSKKLWQPVPYLLQWQRRGSSCGAYSPYLTLLRAAKNESIL
jgi:hypothetical protein